MADDPLSLHIDSDWKKQAQEEKRKLVEEEQKRAAAAPPAAPTLSAPRDPRGGGAGMAAAPSAGPRGARGRRGIPPPTFSSLVQSMVTQVLYYLGDLNPGGGQPPLNLDMAKHQMDLLSMLEEKTANNLTPEEKEILDHGLYETRMRFVNVASQFLWDPLESTCRHASLSIL